MGSGGGNDQISDHSHDDISEYPGYGYSSMGGFCWVNPSPINSKKKVEVNTHLDRFLVI